MPPAHAHFNGSVNLADADTVMRQISARVPSGVRRLPDGETGERGNWIVFQLQKFMQQPWMVPVTPPDAVQEGDYTAMPQLRLADGVNPAEVSWFDLGYADAYLESYATFSGLRNDGVIPAGVRFQVQYPTPMASISGFIAPEDQQALLGSYEEAMFADLDRLLAAIPHDDVAVQWDVAVEFGILEDAFFPDGVQFFAPVVAAVARCVDQVPADVPVGLHLCYGDYGHQHFKQPESLALQVRVVNAVSAAAGRPLSFVSFTVPQNQREDSYFAPLADLTVGPDTELNFGLVPYHPADQEPGTTDAQARLIDSALADGPAARSDWGISTECGMGRASRDDVPVLLDKYREILAAELDALAGRPG